MKRIYVTLALVLFAWLHTQAQTILDTPVEWTSGSYINLYDTASQSASFTIRTTASSITLTQGEQSKEFDIVSHTGSWNDIEANGELVCTVTFGSSSGTVTLARANDVYTITIDFSQHPQGMKRRFTISNYSPE